jgi:dihydrofolate reductase
LGVALIWAQSRNGVIGTDGGLPWHVPEDMQRFRELTTGATVVMGRLTWESLPQRFRPLPGRRNIVLTRDPSYAAPGADVMASLTAALASAPDVWVIGGGVVYAAALRHAQALFVTDIDDDVDGDVVAPSVGDDWREVSRDPRDGWHTSQTGVRYRWRELRRG